MDNKPTEVWIVCKHLQNYCVGVYASEQQAAELVDRLPENGYYYEHHEVN